MNIGLGEELGKLVLTHVLSQFICETFTESLLPQLINVCQHTNTTMLPQDSGYTIFPWKRETWIEPFFPELICHLP